MAEGAKPVAANQVANSGGAPPVFPATKAQRYGSALPAYRPQAPSRGRRRDRRGCGGRCCAWAACAVLGLVVLAAVAGGVFYLVYRPRSPSFALTSARLTAFNVTAGGDLSSRVELTVTAVNPNKKVGFVYGLVRIGASTGDVWLGEGSLPGFRHEPGAEKTLKTAAAAAAAPLGSPAAAAELRKKTAVPLLVVLEAKAGAVVGSVTTKKIRLRVSCAAADVAVPGGKAGGGSAAVNCKVKLRIKIWKWYL
ncbi:late embryogenesis abundant (LEA) hydroxyproline-rich glycoprotein family [Wolffia australiana]